VSVDWEAFRKRERILRGVWEASCEELDTAGWGSHPRSLIPENWQTHKPKHRGGKPRKHFTEAAIQAAAKESRTRYENRRKTMRHQTKQAQEMAAYQRAKQRSRAMQRDFDKNRKIV
jgi:hypothetical protein